MATEVDHSTPANIQSVDQSAQPAKTIPVTFTSSAGVYQFKDGADSRDVQDQLDARLAQLCAMLHIVVSDGFDAFNNMNDVLKNNYLWSCAMIADECKDLAEYLPSVKAAA